MSRFHCFFDDHQHAILIEDHPDALDAAPYDRMVQRGRMLDKSMAELALVMLGGELIAKDGTVRVVDAPGVMRSSA